MRRERRRHDLLLNLLLRSESLCLLLQRRFLQLGNRTVSGKHRTEAGSCCNGVGKVRVAFFLDEGGDWCRSVGGRKFRCAQRDSLFGCGQGGSCSGRKAHELVRTARRAGCKEDRRQRRENNAPAGACVARVLYFQTEPLPGTARAATRLRLTAQIRRFARPRNTEVTNRKLLRNITAKIELRRENGQKRAEAARHKLRVW